MLLPTGLFIYIPEAQLKIFNIEGLRDQNVEGCFSNMYANIQVNGSYAFLIFFLVGEGGVRAKKKSSLNSPHLILGG